MPLLSYKNYPFYNFHKEKKDFDIWDDLPSVFWFNDHIGGYDENFRNVVLDGINKYAEQTGKKYTFFYHQTLDFRVKENYQNIKFEFSVECAHDTLLYQFEKYKVHPEISFRNFLCSFNGSGHVGRQFLTAALSKFKFFNIESVTKNFLFDSQTLIGNISDYTDNDDAFYLKFFDTSDQLAQKINNINYQRYNHDTNIYNLESILSSSFLHIVSESLATSYQPHISEKSFYSIVTRGLFLTYAQPGWHDHLERYYGFRKYDRIFDYRFDAIQNPVERLVELMSMISKFSVLSSDDWRDLYEMESETIEYNYDHYFSGRYLEVLRDNA